jgi:hypothetical protein
MPTKTAMQRKREAEVRVELAIDRLAVAADRRSFHIGWRTGQGRDSDTQFERSMVLASAEGAARKDLVDAIRRYGRACAQAAKEQTR